MKPIPDAVGPDLSASLIGDLDDADDPKIIGRHHGRRLHLIPAQPSSSQKTSDHQAVLFSANLDPNCPGEEYATHDEEEGERHPFTRRLAIERPGKADQGED